MLKLPLSTSGGDVLLIVPPFAVVNRTSLGLHILQACAKEAGFTVSVLYANIIFAADIGMKAYMAICTAPFQMLAGERSFARAAYGVPPLGWNADRALEAYAAGDVSNDNGTAQLQTKYNVIKLRAAAFKDLETRANQWVEEVAGAIAVREYKVVGCTTMFEQTAASIALLNRVKGLRPEIVTIIGGPNCEGEMAEGIAGLSQAIDYIFSGESEKTFVAFLAELFAGKRPAKRIIYGQPCQDLDALPMPDFQEYYEQLNHYLPAVAAKPGSVELTYETSRGCWWGQKHHCTFCGLNGMGMGFREKSAGKVITELKQLLAQHPYPTHLVQMTDNIMPYTFFKTLVPELAGLVVEMPTLRLYYEQKANLSLEQVVALMKAADGQGRHGGAEYCFTTLCPFGWYAS
jgi:ribosomal peptide maturation radical SAM protein 1